MAASESTLPQQDTLDSIFRAHYQRIARVIGRVVFDQARAEELSVEVLLKWKPGVTEGWLYRIAAHEALDELRRQARRRRLHRIVEAVLRRPERDPEQLFEASAERVRVRTVLEALPSRQAEALLLWAEELSYREIAEALPIRANYVGSFLSRAQDAFRKEYLKRYAE